MSKLTIAIPEYHQHRVKPRSIQDLADMMVAEKGPIGLWELTRFDTRSGRELSRLWCKNIITDNGALSMLKNNWNNAGGTVLPFNQIALAPSSGCTTLTTALVSGNVYTTLAVNSLPAAIAAGSTITIGYGLSTTQTVTTPGGAILGAVSITVTSFTANANYAIGANIVPNPNVTDNPSAITSAVYSGVLPGGSFVFSGSGVGNRQVQITYTFTTATTAGNYTDLWTVNTNPVSATGQTASHLIFPAQVINSNTSFQALDINKV